MHRGSLLEARWFANNAVHENVCFGSEPLTDEPIAAKMAFADATQLSRTRRQALEEVLLLDLYALFGKATRTNDERAPRCFGCCRRSENSMPGLSAATRREG